MGMPVKAADYVIIGGGSAGCVLANRLSEDPDVRVVLLEAGPSDWHPAIHMPAGYAYLMKSAAVDWKYHTVPQKTLGGRVLYFPRGRVLGGCGAVNGMVYVRGDRSDFDLWAQLGNRGWSYEECLPYFMKAENALMGADGFHGANGPMAVSKGEIAHPLAKAWLQAAQQAGYRYNDDYNGESQEGVGPVYSTISNGRRVNSSTAYLAPVRARRNLSVVTGAMASRVVLAGERCAAVEFIHKGRISTIAVEREAILCAGAINSPQLLQLSGIGDGDHLSSVGVQPFHDLPGVGLNLQDHVSSSVKQLSLIPSLSRQLKPWNAALALLQYGLFRTGPVSGSGNEILTFVKTRPDLVAPDLEIILLLLLYTDHGRQINPLDGFSAHLCLQRPVSTGSVLIRSADPIVYPDIDPNYYSEPEDLATMRESIRVARDIISQDALSSFRGNEFAPGRTVQTPFELDEYIRASAETTYHASCSCKMGNDDLAVVDDQLRVRGLKGLRVADASVMPRVVSGNTNATTVMIAERAADFLLNRTLQAPREFQTELVPFESSKGDQRGSVMN